MLFVTLNQFNRCKPTGYPIGLRANQTAKIRNKLCILLILGIFLFLGADFCARSKWPFLIIFASSAKKFVQMPKK